MMVNSLGSPRGIKPHYELGDPSLHFHKNAKPLHLGVHTFTKYQGPQTTSYFQRLLRERAEEKVIPQVTF